MNNFTEAEDTATVQETFRLCAETGVLAMCNQALKGILYEAAEFKKKVDEYELKSALTKEECAYVARQYRIIHSNIVLAQWAVDSAYRFENITSSENQTIN